MLLRPSPLRLGFRPIDRPVWNLLFEAPIFIKQGYPSTHPTDIPNCYTGNCCVAFRFLLLAYCTCPSTLAQKPSQHLQLSNQHETGFLSVVVLGQGAEPMVLVYDAALMSEASATLGSETASALGLATVTL